MSKLSDGLKNFQRKFCTAVVVAAGSSERMGQDKMFIEIGRIPVLARAIQALEDCRAIDEIIVVTRSESIETVSTLCHNYRFRKVSKVIAGGATRTESALAGVSQADKKAKLICIHDGARPLVTPEIIEQTVRAAQFSKAAAPAVPVKDTVRVRREGDVYDTPDREAVFAMQTPQAFDADLIKAALTAAVKGGKSYTDDCAAVEALGAAVRLTQGSEENLKITTPEDLLLAGLIAEKRRRGT